MTENDFLMIATKNGMVKRIDVATLPDKIRSTGLILTNLNEGDEVRSVAIVKEDDNVMLVTKDGQCLCYPVSNVRPMGRTAAGVHGMKLNPGDEVVNMQPQQKDHSVIIVTEKAYAKRIDSTQFKEFKTRNGKGQRAIQAAKMTQTGKIISVMNVDNEDADLVLITDSGKVLRTPVAKIPVYSRVARGVRTMKLPDGVNVADATQIDKAKEEDVALFDDELITNAHEELNAEE
jgi:DNA gyrase subunit A